MTNYEYLRSLPLEEMAKEFMFMYSDWCDSHCEGNGECDTCEDCMIRWLKSDKRERKSR